MTRTDTTGLSKTWRVGSIFGGGLIVLIVLFCKLVLWRGFDPASHGN